MENDWTSNTHSSIAFDNPGFDQDAIYDSISPATASTIQANLKQTKDSGLQELRFQDNEKNNVPSKPEIEDGNTDCESLDAAGKTNPTYGLALHGASKTWNPEEQYAAIQKKETTYAVLRPTATVSQQLRAGDPLQDDAEYLKPAEVQPKVPRDNSGSATDEDELYVDFDFKDESLA